MFRGCASIVNRGGDTDTIGAVTGAAAGARFGSTSLPRRWLDVIDDETNWKRSYGPWRQPRSPVKLACARLPETEIVGANSYGYNLWWVFLK